MKKNNLLSLKKKVLTHLITYLRQSSASCGLIEMNNNNKKIETTYHLYLTTHLDWKWISYQCGARLQKNK